MATTKSINTAYNFFQAVVARSSSREFNTVNASCVGNTVELTGASLEEIFKALAAAHISRMLHEPLKARMTIETFTKCRVTLAF